MRALTSAYWRSRLVPPFWRLIVPLDPDPLAYLTYRHADDCLLLGTLAVAISAVPLLVLPRHPGPMALQRIVFWSGLALIAAGVRFWLLRWCLHRWRQGSTRTVAKSEIDSVLQLSNLLTTVGGFSLLANADVFFGFWVALNVLLGIVVLDNSIQLTNDQSSSDGVVFSNVNVGLYGAVRRLILFQVGAVFSGITWLLATRV